MSWYVVVTHRNRERQAVAGLMRYGVESYLPQYWWKRKGHHAAKYRGEMVKRPLFPGYLFIEAETPPNKAVSSCEHISRFLMSAEDTPAEIGADEIERLQKLERNGALEIDKPTLSKWKRGDIARIGAGPFTGFNCVIVKHDKAMVRALIDGIEAVLPERILR